MSAKRESKLTERVDSDTAMGGVADQPLESGLWLVATPIGNLGDITIRAISVLRNADMLVCEDTRRTRRLMDLLDIPLGGRRLMSYHDRNGAERRPQVLEALDRGASVAYASDAGTPLIADPGYRLVIDAQEQGHSVFTAPGPSAVIAALTLAGLPTDRFFFGGFLPPKSSARKRVMEELKGLKATLVFFESPRRISAALADLVAVLGRDRPAAIVREITKTYEEVQRDTLGALSDRHQEEQTKGEIVLLLGPPDKSQNADAEGTEVNRLLTEALMTLSVKDAARDVAKQLGLPRRDVYARALDLSRQSD